MKIHLPMWPVLLVAMLQAAPVLAADAALAGSQAQDPLFDQIAGLDAKVFDAFNHCSEPGRLEEHAGYFAPGIEFYHDTGGVTWSRDEMIANTRKYVCGHFTRELIPGTLKVYPVKDFGAISQGTHRFCQIDSGKCEGLADFLVIWQQSQGRWEITRVVSYGHRAVAAAQ